MSTIDAKKIYFEFVNLGAMKIFITVKFERKAFELNIANPSSGFGLGSIIYTVFTTVASISESPICFKELIFVHCFTSQ